MKIENVLTAGQFLKYLFFQYFVSWQSNTLHASESIVTIATLDMEESYGSSSLSREYVENDTGQFVLVKKKTTGFGSVSHVFRVNNSYCTKTLKYTLINQQNKFFTY